VVVSQVLNGLAWRVKVVSHVEGKMKKVWMLLLSLLVFGGPVASGARAASGYWNNYLYRHSQADRDAGGWERHNAASYPVDEKEAGGDESKQYDAAGGDSYYDDENYYDAGADSKDSDSSW